MFNLGDKVTIEDFEYIGKPEGAEFDGYDAKIIGFRDGKAEVRIRQFEQGDHIVIDNEKQKLVVVRKRLYELEHHHHDRWLSFDEIEMATEDSYGSGSRYFDSYRLR